MLKFDYSLVKGTTSKLFQTHLYFFSLYCRNQLIIYLALYNSWGDHLVDGTNRTRILIYATHKCLTVFAKISIVYDFIHETFFSAINRSPFFLVLLNHRVHLCYRAIQGLSLVLIFNQSAGIWSSRCCLTVHDSHFTGSCAQGECVIVVLRRTSQQIVSSSMAFSQDYRHIRNIDFI